jgi:hypothetical protein
VKKANTVHVKDYPVIVHAVPENRCKILKISSYMLHQFRDSTWMRSIAEWLERLIANAKIISLGFNTFDIMESEGRQMKEC